MINVQARVPIQQTLITMYHPQPEIGITLKYDRKNGAGIARSFMETKRSKYQDMRYHWLEDHKKMVHLNPYWPWLINKWAYYFIKYDTSANHKIMRYNYLKKLHIMTNKFLSNHMLLFAPHATHCTRVC